MHWMMLFAQAGSQTTQETQKNYLTSLPVTNVLLVLFKDPTERKTQPSGGRDLNKKKLAPYKKTIQVGAL